jgi:dTDP-4-amino-4,6-dideoxygalactose transaminase
LTEFGYTPGMCPEAEKACREVINLPTHLKVDTNTAERTLAFMKEVGKPA